MRRHRTEPRNTATRTNHEDARISTIHTVRAFTAHETAAIIWTAAGASSWCAAGINDDLAVDPNVRACEILEASAMPALFETARDRLFAATRPLAAELAPGTVLAEMQIVRYGVGGKYVDHRDTLALGSTPRALSIVCYLNDDFTGGETVFRDPDATVTPSNGTAIVFSPILMHRAEPVRSGTKYVITAWYHVVPPRIAGA
jgi:predicted 2-oxoglutarate/Fe(II)-dependent dioxygenase YbiX